MSVGRDESSHWSVADSRPALRIVTVVSVTAMLTVIVLVTLSSAGVAENEPPELHSGEKIDKTTVKLLFTDDTGVDGTTIKPDDFLLSAGEVDRIDVTELERNATAKIHLKEPIDRDELVVEVLPDSNITDVNGTELAGDFPGVTFEEMDGVAPRLLRLDAINATGDNVSTIEAHFHEEVSEFDLFIGGQTIERFGRADSEKVNDYVYEIEYKPDTDGRYFVRVDSATDTAGNSVNPTGRAEFWAFVEPPATVATIDFTESSGNQFTFDAGQTTGNVTEYRWDFDDGTNATGERVSHEFGGGNYTVTLEAVDAYGNVGTDELGISLPGERPDNETTNETAQPEFNTTVSIEGNGTDSVEVSITNATASEPVRATAPDGLLQDGQYSLDAVNVTVNERRDLGYGIASMNPDVITDATQGDDERLVGGFFVSSDIDSGDIEQVVFEFSIDDDQLESIDTGPSGITLRTEAGDDWTTLQTTHVGTSDGTYRFETTTDGFSPFAVVGDADAESAGSEPEAGTGTESTLSVTDATLNETTISAGDTVSVDATVENSGNGDGEFVAGLEFNGSVVDAQSLTVAGGSSETVTFTRTVDEPQTVAVSVNETDAGTLTVEGDAGAPTANELPDWLELSNVSVEPAEIAPGESVTVTATAENVGDELDGSDLELRVNGSVEDTTFIGPINPGDNRPVEFTYQLNESGTTTFAINNTEAGEVTVTEGGGLFSFLGVFGFIPFGLLRTVFLFVALPILLIYLILKGVAYYLGY